jgi:hypothetical protein
MLTLTKTCYENLPEGILERLYNESLDRNVVEIERLGEDSLRDIALNNYAHFPVLKYEVNGYVVGVASYYEKDFNGKKYYVQRHCVYGKTPEGSRSWWWSEEFQLRSWEYFKQENLDGILAVHNPDSEIGKAVLGSFGRFNKYYGIPQVVEAEEVKLLMDKDSYGVLKCFIIDLLEE